MERPFVKVVAPGGWDFSGEPVTQIVKASAFGLRGNDLKALVKRAGHQFADAFRRLELQPGEVPVHLLAMGATEFYGPNRNGDGFKCATCRKYHDTFRKYARWYRNHANKDPRKSYGVVKLASYNERMHRIELLVALNGKEAAAERNGGLVADQELEKLARGDDLAVSMACKVPFDVCSSCGNKARNRDEYCRGVSEGGLCKAGGLRNKIATFCGEDGDPILHADNPDPCFFDISWVPRPADRIAFTTGVMSKTAGVDVSSVLGGARQAEVLGVTAPGGLEATGVVADALDMARKMAGYESAFAGGLDRHALAFVGQPPTAWADHGGRMGEALSALARSKVAMPLGGFLEFVNRDPEKAASAAAGAAGFLPGVYGRLLENGQLPGMLESNPFVPSAGLPPLAVRRWADAKIAAYGIDGEAVERRVIRAAVRDPRVPAVRPTLEKAAGAAAEVAAHYAVYKLAFAAAAVAGGADRDLTLRLCVAQNYT